ncbi:LPD38 domain-containing protein [Thalassobellus suaedae]|uniref:LPD38 domain-containing protein n=1 Tax=Thalassobellus suaedae TaxID=3074124 RepID=A0ABY9XVX8_9FLAO|nr:LPD38 domain-containing protein [Flavobacteriaceae bacterium HL-DH14]
MNINYLLEALDDTSETSLKKEMDDVIKLLIAERTVEYVEKFGRTNNLTGIGGGIKTDLEVAQGHLNEVEQLKKDNKEQYTRIKEGARRYREFADAGLKYAVEKGRISKEQYKNIKETNQYYVSLARTKEVTPGDELLPFLNESGKITSVKEVIKKAKGGSDVIKNPYLSLLHNTVNFIKESDRNEVMQSFVEPLTEVRNMGDGTPIDLSQIARKVPSGEKNTIKVYKDGELQHWQFDQDIYEALKGLEGIAHNKLINVLGKPANLIRFTVTNFPVFALRNAFRDTMSRLVISRTRGKVSDLWHDHKDRELFETYGGSQAGFYLTNKDAYVDEMNKAVKDITKKGGVILDPRKLNYESYRKLLERGENLNRVAEYKSAYRKAKKDGMDDYNAGLYAAYQARDLMDFAVAGHYMRVINKLVPFSNASVQSVKRSVKGAKENPGKFALRMALFTVIPQLAFRALVRANGDDDEYEQLPDYQRDLFWNFKTPMTGDTWISLPKPFELGMPSSLIDRGVSKAQGKKDAFDGATMSSIKTLFPFDETALVGSLKPIIEASSNHDFFRDRDIVPFWEKDKLLKLRDGTKYASRIGSALSDGFGFVGTKVDPRKIDHIIKGYTTYYGDWALSFGDIGKEDSRYQFNFSKTGFAKDAPISNAKSVKKALDLAKDIGVGSNKKVKKLKGMQKAYYDLDDTKAKKILRKEIYEYAKKLTVYLEEMKSDKLSKVDD